MCVIAIVTKNRPDHEMIEKMWAPNDHGGGAAWRELDKQGNSIVRWMKGFDLKEMHRLAKSLPLPHILHFRAASKGMEVKDELCHPFAIDRKGSVELQGSTKNHVLFHNGTWWEWEKWLQMLVTSTPGLKMPEGPWSDTRAIALMTHFKGIPYVDLFIKERMVMFGPDTGDAKNDMPIFGGSDSNPLNKWQNVNGILVSNTRFLQSPAQKVINYYTEKKPEGEYGDKIGFCKDTECRSKFLNKEGWCPLHNPKGGSKSGLVGSKSGDCHMFNCVFPAVNGSSWCAKHSNGIGSGSVQAMVVIPRDGKVHGAQGNNQGFGGNPGPGPTPFAILEEARFLNRMGKLSNKKLKRAEKEYERVIRAFKKKVESINQNQNFGTGHRA